MVKVICQHAVGRSSAAAVGLLVGNENIKRLFLLRDFKNALLNFVDRLCFFLVNAALICVGIFQRRFVVIIVENGRVLRTVYRGDTIVCRGVFDIFDSVAAKHQRPISLGVGAVLGEDLFVDAHCLVEIIVSAEVIRAVVEICFSVVVKTRERLLRSAGIAHSDGRALLEFNLATAHFAFKR